MKRELRVNQGTWPSPAEARREVFRWIAFHNHRRRHSALGQTSPADYERTLRPDTVIDGVPGGRTCCCGSSGR